MKLLVQHELLIEVAPRDGSGQFVVNLCEMINGEVSQMRQSPHCRMRFHRGSQRNQFDRIAHFSVGFYAFAMAEWLLRKRHCKPLPAMLFSLFMVMAVAAAYEIIEYWFAVYYGGDAGIEFLGSQGDVWDAQKDMLADTLGAVLALLLYAGLRPDRRHSQDFTQREGAGEAR